MTQNKRAEKISRDSVLRILSATEIATVRQISGDERLAEGDEYLDLEHVENGIRKARGTTVRMGTVLPKKSFHDDTWGKIVNLLASSQ